MNVVRKIILIGAGCFASSLVEARTWTNDRGMEIEGELVLLREKDLVLKLQDGRKVAVPLAVLSGEDMSYAREWERAGNNRPDSAEGTDEPDVGSWGVVGDVSSKARRSWPERVRVEDVFLSKTIQESPRFSVYESDHFHFESPRRLHDEERKHLVSQFEGALSVLAKLPFDFPLAHRENGHYIVDVFFGAEEYEKAGGRKNTRVSMTPSRLLVRLRRNSKGKSLGLSEVKPLGTLSRWVSQFSMDVYWLGEGFGEYMDAVPKDGHSYDFSDWPRVVARVPRTIRRRHVSLPSLEKLMTYRGDLSREKDEGKRVRMRYGALLAAVYFLRMDGEGDGSRIAKYMEALQAGKDNPVEILLDKRSWKELELEMTRSWKKHKVSLKFENGEEKRAGGGKKKSASSR